MTILTSLYRRRIALENRKAGSTLTERLQGNAPTILHDDSLDSKTEENGSWGLCFTVTQTIISTLMVQVGRSYADSTLSAGMFALDLSRAASGILQSTNGGTDS